MNKTNYYSNYRKYYHMRCKNCGWPNKPGETTCVKCNSLLSSKDENTDFIGEDEMSQSSRPLNKTVMEAAAFGTEESTDDQHVFQQTKLECSEDLTQCTKCGYPLRAGVDKCPNCKSTISHKNGSKGGFSGTINPYMMNLNAEPTFVLKPVKRMDERRNFDEKEYEGRQVVLNRDNTESGNSSITSKEQAIVSYCDGLWFIEDKSEQKTTFVQASRKIELHDGDIILLGNRIFEFHK